MMRLSRQLLSSKISLPVVSRRAQFDDLLLVLTGQPPRTCSWTSLIELAAETLTIGKFAQSALLPTFPRALPIDVHDLLVDVLQRARERNRRLITQLSELLRPLNCISVKPIVMRGAARILDCSEEGSRLLSDIDLLVPPERLRACVQAMCGMGYRRLSNSDENLFPVVLGRPTDVGAVDVHSRLRPVQCDIGYHEVVSNCREIELSGGKLLIPSATMQLLFNIVHDQLHDGDYWRGLMDVRHLSEFPALVAAGVDWAALSAFFPRGSARNALQVQLRTARRFLNVDIPETQCGGLWAQLQVSRRRLQLDHPRLFTPFTILTRAVDPPPRSRNYPGPGFRKRPGVTLRRPMSRMLRQPGPGKLLMR
jgi:hypothetical protein